jgi:uncharacterized repeat protein (TIGR01451 family)
MKFRAGLAMGAAVAAGVLSLPAAPAFANTGTASAGPGGSASTAAASHANSAGVNASANGSSHSSSHGPADVTPPASPTAALAAESTSSSSSTSSSTSAATPSSTSSSTSAATPPSSTSSSSSSSSSSVTSSSSSSSSSATSASPKPKASALATAVLTVRVSAMLSQGLQPSRAGDTIRFTYRVDNSGTAALTGLQVRDPAVGKNTCSGTIAAGGQSTCSATHTITTADLTSGGVTSSPVASGMSAGVAVTSPATRSTVMLSTAPVSGASLTLSQKVGTIVDRDNDHKVSAGDQLDYSYVVTNTGKLALSSLAISSARLALGGAGVTCTSTNVAPGASVTCRSGRVTISTTEAKAHAIYTSATARARAGDKTVISNTVTTRRFVGYVAPRSATAAASATKAAARAPRSFARITLLQWVVKQIDSNNNRIVDAGDKIVYGFKVSNAGTRTVSRVRIVDDKLVRNGVSVFCASTTLAPGTSIYCQSGELVVTPYLAKHTIGKNFAYATGVDSTGAAVRSNTTLTTVGQRVGDVSSASLAFTGAEIGTSLNWSFGLIGLGGVLVLLTRVRRRVELARAAHLPLHTTSGG